MKTKVVPLDERAIRHLRSQLEWANPLGRAVLATVALEDGAIATLLPEAHQPGLYNFDEPIFPPGAQARTPIEGGYMERVPSTDAALTPWVRTVLQSQLRSALVCESFLMRAEHLALASGPPQSRTMTCGDFVYNWAQHDDPEPAVADVVNELYPLPLGFGVICTLPTVSAELLGAVIEPPMLATIAQSTDCILLGVYDGESVLAWTRRGSPFQFAP